MGIFGKVKETAQAFDDVGRGYWTCPGLDASTPSSMAHNPENPHEYRFEAVDKDDANLVSSLCKDKLHRPVLDFDIPARYVPSTTPGHGHLYIDVALTWEQYEKLLILLGDFGILEEGYVHAAIDRKATFVRPEWVKKPEKETDEY